MIYMKYALALLSGLLLTLIIALTIGQRSRTITSEIWIASQAEDVWQILMETDAYQQWNPMIRRIKGELKIGNTIKIEIGSDNNVMIFHPIILDMRVNALLLWRGSFLFTGIFDGEHKYELVPDNGGVLFRQSEHFSGLLVGYFTDMIVSDIGKSFADVNVALKDRSEAIRNIDK